MAIQFRRQITYHRPKEDAKKYIENKLLMFAGEPILCTYRESNGEWGSFLAICVYPMGTHISNTIFNNMPYENMPEFKDGRLVKNVVQYSDDSNSSGEGGGGSNPIWQEIK